MLYDSSWLCTSVISPFWTLEVFLVVLYRCWTEYIQILLLEAHVHLSQIRNFNSLRIWESEFLHLKAQVVKEELEEFAKVNTTCSVSLPWQLHMSSCRFPSVLLNIFDHGRLRYNVVFIYKKARDYCITYDSFHIKKRVSKSW
jgi:hypothetical protein